MMINLDFFNWFLRMCFEYNNFILLDSLIYCLFIIRGSWKINGILKLIKVLVKCKFKIILKVKRNCDDIMIKNKFYLVINY